MACKQAMILSSDTLKQLRAYAITTRHPVRNKLIVLLSVRAGLRTGEIAILTWDKLFPRSPGFEFDEDCQFA